MRQILGFLVAVLLFTAPLVYAQDFNPMYDFYKGLADVIERNMGNPQSCVTEAETFVRDNIGALQASIEQAQQMAPEQPAAGTEGFDTMSDSQQADMAKGMEALDRFMQVFNTFAQNSPAEAERIAGFISQYAPQPAEMEPPQAEQYEPAQEQLEGQPEGQ